MVVFDTSTIILVLNPDAKPPTDENNQVVEKCKERIEFLIDKLIKAKTQILIPTPVFAEYLVGCGPNKHEFVDIFFKSRNFELGNFDTKAAIELSMLIDPDLQSGKKLNDKTTKAKIKFDRQIVAIAKSRNAQTIFTDDAKLANCARNNKISAIMTWELELPPVPPQLVLNLGNDNNETEAK